MSDGTIRKMVDNVTAELGIGCSHHSFRHFWVNRLLVQGVPLSKIGHLAHHASLETTITS